MSDEKPEEKLGGRAHKLALGAQAVAAVSVLLLVPLVRRLRAQRHERRHHRRLLLGH